MGTKSSRHSESAHRAIGTHSKLWATGPAWEQLKTVPNLLNDFEFTFNGASLGTFNYHYDPYETWGTQEWQAQQWQEYLVKFSF